MNEMRELGMAALMIVCCIAGLFSAIVCLNAIEYHAYAAALVWGMCALLWAHNVWRCLK